MSHITGGQIRAARAFLRWSAEDLASRSRLGVATIRRAEAQDGVVSLTSAIRHAFESAGVQFIPENGGGVGVRLRCPASNIRGESLGQAQPTPENDQ
jgi:transcriptional regulator with XRE-family HTH domain